MSYQDKHRQPQWFEKNKAHALLVVKAPTLARKSGLLVPSSVPSAVLHGSLSRDCIRSARLIEQSKRSRSPSHKSWPATQRLLVTCTRHSTKKKQVIHLTSYFCSFKILFCSHICLSSATLTVHVHVDKSEVGSDCERDGLRLKCRKRFLPFRKNWKLSEPHPAS